MRPRPLRVATALLGLRTFVGCTLLEPLGAPFFTAWQARLAASVRMPDRSAIA